MKLSIRFVSLALTISCTGCLEGERHQVFRYDSKKDEIQCLTLYLNIYGSRREDLEYLKDIWNNRANIIPDLPFPLGELQLFGQTELLREEPGAYVSFPIGERGIHREVKKSPFNLQEILIKPGAFFLSPERNLSAYHYTLYSSKAIDGLLEIGNAELQNGLFEHAVGELDRRKKGGKQFAWSDYRSMELRNAIMPKSPATVGENGKTSEKKVDTLSPSTFECFEEESLKQLISSTVNKTIHIDRKKLLVSTQLWLSHTDSRQIQVTFEAIKDILKEEVEAGRDKSGDKKVAFDTLSQIIVRNEAGALSISIDLQQIFDKLTSVTALRQNLASDAKKDLSDEHRIALKNTVAFIRGEGIEIADLTLDALLQAFERNALPVVTPTIKTKPGEGLFYPAK